MRLPTISLPSSVVRRVRVPTRSLSVHAGVDSGGLPSIPGEAREGDGRRFVVRRIAIALRAGVLMLLFCALVDERSDAECAEWGGR
jgi:hypothetical protein